MNIMKRALLATAVVSATMYNANAQTPDSVLRYIDSAIYFMQAKSLHGKNLNWRAITDTVQSMARGARSYKDAFPSLVYAFSQLKDYHGMIASPDTFYRYPSPVNFDEVLSEGIKKEFLKGNRIVTSSFNRVAYLRIPPKNVTKRSDMDQRANMLRDSLCKLMATKPRALILDLRLNSGGNSAPMISGIGPLFHKNVLGYGVDRDNKFLSPVRIQKGIILDEKGNKSVTVRNNCSVPATLPVAVLIGPSTVSSGEILAAFLKQQHNVKLFGEATPGYCNATEGFTFMNNQGYLLLTVNKIADGNKFIYEDMRVMPHVFIKSQDNYDNLTTDPTVKSALDWVKPRRKK